VDIQTSRPFGDPDAVRKETHELVDSWSTSDGGFIIFNYGDSAGTQLSSEIKNCF